MGGFWQLEVGFFLILFYFIQKRGFVFEGLSVISVCEGLCSTPPAPPQQLQLSAEAFARSFLSSLMGSGNSL